MSRVRRAGKTFTSISVIALPITAGMTRNGMKRGDDDAAGTASPPSYTTPYAANIGIAISTTIQLECNVVSSSFAP